MALTTLAAVPAVRAAGPGFEVIGVPGSDAEYLVDRARQLCFFKAGGAITPVDCARVLGTGPGRRDAPSSPGPVVIDFGKGATLELGAHPWAQVQIDGRPAGTTPRTQPVAPGEHRVTYMKGSLRIERTLVVKRGQTWTLSADMDDDGPTLWATRRVPAMTARELGKGTKLVLLAWPSATFTVDGVKVGQSPLVIDVGPGAHIVGAQRGEREARTYVEAIAGGELRVDAGTLDAPPGVSPRLDAVPMMP